MMKKYPYKNIMKSYFGLNYCGFYSLYCSYICYECEMIRDNKNALILDLCMREI